MLENSRIHGERFGFDPFRLVEIDPREVRLVTPASAHTVLRRNAQPGSHNQPDIDRGCFLIRRSLGLVLDGDWDRSDIRVEQMNEYRSLRAAMFEGVAWLDTPWAEQTLRWLHGAGMTAEAGYFVRHRWDEIRALIDSIQTHGVRPSGTDPAAGGFYDNVNVNLARDGSVLFEGGFHRFCIARLLGLASIPVVVIVRHRANFPPEAPGG